MSTVYLAQVYFHFDKDGYSSNREVIGIFATEQLAKTACETQHNGHLGWIRSHLKSSGYEIAARTSKGLLYSVWDMEVIE